MGRAAEQRKKNTKSPAASIDFQQAKPLHSHKIYIYFEYTLFNTIELCFSALQSGNAVIKMHLLCMAGECIV